MIPQISQNDDTIYALATPPGRSGVAITRLSGPRARAIAEEVIGGKLGAKRHAVMRRLRGGEGEIIDDALVLYFAAPASFTGEDIVEFQTHGGRAIIAALSERLSGLGARLAEAGEFTRRALLAGKMGLLEVEALGDLIDADTGAQLALARSGIAGEAEKWARALRERLVETMGLVTAAIDFSDEDLPPGHDEAIRSSIKALQGELAQEIERSKRASSLKGGYRVAIMGAPNVGKSSLLNRLIGREMAIASEIAGTTRDAIEVFLDLGGLPVILIDTAGLRESIDPIERMGIKKAEAMAESSDLRIWLYEKAGEREEISARAGAGDLLVRTKADLYGEEPGAISAQNGYGIDDLLAQIRGALEERAVDAGYFAHERQRQLLSEAEGALLEACEIAREKDMRYEFLAEAIRAANFALARLLGEVDVEEALGFVFSRFCIGK